MSFLVKLRFKDQTFKLRENAILDATTKLLAAKGFDLITMDDVAAEVGLSKPSLYKHFKSKEDLVTEAMIRLVDEALAYLKQQPDTMSPLERLRSLLEWALRVRLGGGMPFLPSTSAHVRAFLTQSLRYVTRALKLHRLLDQVVSDAKRDGELASELPNDVILYSFYARTCDPAVEYLRLYGKYDDDAIVAHMQSVCFAGIGTRPRS
ncbi:MAG: TetR/AcrR family transcriptional regulator [Pseudomonadota bacterium]